jgi:ATP-binding cassette subfamily C protein LapB
MVDTLGKPFGLLRCIFAQRGIFSDSLRIIISTGLINALGLALPLLLMQIYDRIIPNQSIDTLFWLVSGCLIALALETVMRIVRSYVASGLSSRFEANLSMEMVSSLLEADIHYHEEAGERMERFDSVPVLGSFLSGTVFQLVPDLPFLFLYLFLIYHIGGKLVYVPLIIIGIYVLLVGFFRISGSYKRRRRSHNEELRTAGLIDVLSGVHTIKSMSLEEPALRNVEKNQDALSDSYQRLATWDSFSDGLGDFFSQLMLFGVIGYGAASVISGDITVGVLTACSIISGRAMQPVQQLIGLWLKLSEVEIARKKITGIKEGRVFRKYSELQLDARIAGAVELRSVTIKGADGRTFFDEASLTVLPGQMVTIDSDGSDAFRELFYCLTSLTVLEKGEMLLDEYCLSTLHPDSLKGLVEYVPAENFLYQGTILDNVCMFDERYRSMAYEAAALAGLDEPVARLVNGYDTLVDGASDRRFSTDFVQRVAMARALVFRPRVLLIDRTYLGLDIEGESWFLWLLSKLKNKMTIIMITEHIQVDEVADFNSVLMIANRLQIRAMADINYKLSAGKLMVFDAAGAENE